MKEIKRNKLWSVQYTPGDVSADRAVKEISAETGLSELCSRLIYNRGFKTADEARKFLNNEEAILHDPFMLNDIDAAIMRIKKAIESGEKIAIYGDYDVDGVTSVSMLYLYLTSIEGDHEVGYYIPSRDGEGYGLSVAAIDKLAAKGINLIITVDTGITACDEALYASSLGIDMVITDHHECRPELPECCAVVNPHRHDNKYPFCELAGVGVVFKLICAYEMMRCRENGEAEISGVRRVCNEYADLAAIGTIADVMPIIDENRLIVTYGLRMISSTKRLGLAALIEAAQSPTGASQNVKKKKITSSFIGYGIAPRINAAGRISNASKAVELLLADDAILAAKYANELCDINKQRQVEENRIADQAYKKIEKTFDPENDRVIVIDDDGWQQGIIGIVASRITEKYGLPSLLISFDGATRGFPAPDDLGKGSGRSIKGMNLVNAMNSCSDLLCKYGGHELAAGLTIERDKIPEFTKRMNEYAREVLDEDKLMIRLDVDCELSINDVNMNFAQEIYKMEPFGVANPVPQFILRDLTVERVTSIGNGKHTKLVVSRDGVSLNAIYFGMTEIKFDIHEGELIDLLFTIDINEYQNVRSVQLIVQDHKLSRKISDEIENGKVRYAETRGGGSFSPDENIIPVRDDFAVIYNLLRREAGGGKITLSVRRILSMIRQSRVFHADIGYIKLKFIIEILYELRICGVEHLYDDVYEFDMYFNSSKTSIDKSSILKHLKGQCK